MKIYGFSNAVKNKPNQTQLQTNHPIFKISLKNPKFLKNPVLSFELLKLKPS